MNKKFLYPVKIQETYLDSFGHVNNAVYLNLFEDARWEFITQNGFGLEKIKETKLGPVILEIDIKFKREILARQEIVIESQMLNYEKKVGLLRQVMVRDGKDCCIADFKFGLYNTAERKLVLPTKEWLFAIGVA